MTRHATATVERPLSALDAIYARRSVRAYVPHTLERSTVRALLDAAVQAPTAMHSEPWLFVVVQGRRLLRQLSGRVKATAANEPGVPDEFRDPGFDVFYGAGTLIVICARRTDPFVVADCWLAAENLMLAASALGLGTCCIGIATAALTQPDMQAALGIPADVYPIAPIVVGVPAGAVAPAARREPQILSWK